MTQSVDIQTTPQIHVTRRDREIGLASLEGAGFADFRIYLSSSRRRVSCVVAMDIQSLQ